MSGKNPNKRKQGKTNKKGANERSQAQHVAPPGAGVGNRYASPTHQQHESNRPPNNRKWHFPGTAVFTGALVVIGAFAVYFNVLPQRAYIFIDAVNTNNFLVPGNLIDSEFTYRNTGQVSGRILRSCSIFSTGESLPAAPIADADDAQGCDEVRTTLVPNGTKTISHGAVVLSGTNTRVTLLPSVITQIYGGAKKAFIWGFVIYRDDYSFILGNRVLGYCYWATGADKGGRLTWGTCGLPAYEYTR